VDVGAEADIGTVAVRAELCANCECQYTEPASEPSILDLGDDALPVMEGLC